MAVESDVNFDADRLAGLQRAEFALLIEEVENVSGLDAQNPYQFVRGVNTRGDLLRVLVIQRHRHEADDPKALRTGLREIDRGIGFQADPLAATLQNQSPIGVHRSQPSQVGFADPRRAPLVAPAIDREAEYAVAPEGTERLAASATEVDRLLEAHGARAWEEKLYEHVVFRRSAPARVENSPAIEHRLSGSKLDIVHRDREPSVPVVRQVAILECGHWSSSNVDIVVHTCQSSVPGRGVALRGPYFGMPNTERLETRSRKKISRVSACLAEGRGGHNRYGSITMNMRSSSESTAATAEEVEEAVEALTKAQLVRLEKIARFRHSTLGSRAAGRHERDLLSDAIIAVLEGRRKWVKDNCDFVGFLTGVMRSLASHIRDGRALDAYDEVVPNPANEPGSTVDLVDQIEAQASDNPEHLLRARELDNQIRGRFESDPVVLLVYEAFQENMAPVEIRSCLGIDEREYNAAAKRLRRAVRGLTERRSR